MKKKFIAILFILIVVNAAAQKTKTQSVPPDQDASPKLVVGIVIDQMRYDYLYRFWNKYSNDGFKRLLNEGFSFSNANYNYVPTYTAPGHACIYSGTTPSFNGIISNEWFDRASRKSIYCVNDTTVMPVGTTSISGKMSPQNLLTTSITDELKLASNKSSKVIGIALKDRGAILPAGHMADGAYWHDPYSNNWISSTFYMKELPSWVKDFNNRKMIDSLLSKPWNTLLPIEQYTESTSDDNAYEGLFTNETKPTFPHDLPALKATESELIRETPFGNTYTKEFAVSAIRGEKLGKGKTTDFLALSFSSTDYVGHMFGTNAIELEDTYIRLDRELAELLKFLDEWTGKDYLLFLTADHGAVNNPIYTRDNNLNGGKFESGALVDSLKRYIKNIYGTDTLILNSSAHNIYLNRNYIEANKINLQEVQEKCANYVTRQKGVAAAMTSTELSRGILRTGIYSLMQNGFNVQRSADVMIQLQSGWLDWYSKTGTSHGTAYSYDTHVPVIFFGRKIKPGTSAEPITICDIAPTVATMLKIEFPSGNTGKPLIPVLK